MLNVQIRRSHPDDLDKILEVQTAALRALSFTYDSTQVESLVRSQATARTAEDEIRVIAEYEGELIGYAAIMALKPQISGIYVDPRFVRQGVGSQLLEAIEHIGIERGYAIVNVISSLATVDFYKARGYQNPLTTGFYSEQKHWIRCVSLQKQLINIPKVKRWRQHSHRWLSGLKAIMVWLLFQVAVIAIASLVLFLIFAILVLF
ncbi:MAG: GNAT family N-acetyltransferase [Oculatellaceae cyanobacterium bins.114]|nr:GNAT family N-acetyltransferase [Oculatellaceae cyanobacterium bins.114]